MNKAGVITSYSIHYTKLYDTDDVGDEKYNLRLSLQRANSVVNHLVDKGISKSRLTAKGFGESTPIAPNRLPNGDDNPEGRRRAGRRCRRHITSYNVCYTKLLRS